MSESRIKMKTTFESLPCPVCKNPGERNPVEITPAGSILWRVVHDNGDVHEWGQFESFSEMKRLSNHDKVTKEMICPKCGKVGIIYTFRKEKDKPYLVDYKIMHDTGKEKGKGKGKSENLSACYMYDKKYRDQVLKRLGRYLYTEREFFSPCGQ
jgi:hypothetical protein